MALVKGLNKEDEGISKMKRKVPEDAPIETAVPKDEIRFYRASEKPYGVFSNLYRCEVTFEGRT